MYQVEFGDLWTYPLRQKIAANGDFA